MTTTQFKQWAERDLKKIKRERTALGKPTSYNRSALDYYIIRASVLKEVIKKLSKTKAV
jgi:hypothetical protein